jgi:hypothetical protein
MGGVGHVASYRGGNPACPHWNFRTIESDWNTFERSVQMHDSDKREQKTGSGMEVPHFHMHSFFIYLISTFISLVIYDRSSPKIQ